MEKKTAIILIALGLSLLYLYGGYYLAEGPREIPCESYDKCVEIAQGEGIERTTIICGMVDGVDKCKVIVS